MSFTKKWSSALLLLAAMSQNVLAEPSVELAVSGPLTVTSVDGFSVKATLKNTGDKDLKFFNDPNGVLSKAATKTFKVTNADDGTRAHFVGIAVKYKLDKDTSTFTELPVGGTVDVTHGLSNAYEFNSEGSYTIEPSTTLYYADDNGNPVKIQAKLVSTHTAKLVGELKSRALEKRREQHAREEKDQLVKRSRIMHNMKRALTASTQDCSSDQTAEITQSMFYASLYVASAEKYLTMHNSTSDRYKGWFGEFSSDNHATVLQHYNKIRASDVKTYTFSCKCDTENPESTYAYVFPDKFGTVYLCGAYMAANVSGPDSKAGTIVHESSHFLANAGTDDIAYGRQDCATLAAQNATAAIHNADSHEYFAENVNPWYA